VDDDPAEALRIADRAATIAPGTLRASALLSAAWVAHAADAPVGAYLEEGERIAAATNDRWSLAKALEIRAATATAPGIRRARLEQARAIWAELGDPVATARVELALAETAGARGRAAADAARRRLRTLGVRPGAAAAAAGPLRGVASDSPPVTILTLGGLRVLRHGIPVAAGEWQSKKARDLLKLLVVRGGRPAPREALMEALWPDEDPERISNRLSVLLSTVRSVLDPERRFPSEHFVAGDKAALTLDLEAVRVDVEEFLAGAAAGLHALERDGADDPVARVAAIAQLAEAESRCAGELFEDDPYAEWVGPLREEVRATYAAVVRTLAAAAAEDGDTDLAVRYCLRLLERDPYDEEGHLSLVRALDDADRHGEARRRYRFYADRMAELGIEPAPFPVRRLRVGQRRAV
jgi:DNA-binding SARP family transcriptional activator